MKKIIISLAAICAIQGSKTQASDWNNLLYGELVTLYRRGFDSTPEVTTSHFVLATAAREDAIVAKYDVIFHHIEKKLFVQPVGEIHPDLKGHITMIKHWFDDAPDDYHKYQWMGSVAKVSEK